MKGWTKRRIALILALALLASQMSACKKETGPAGNKAVENNNAAVSVQNEANKPEETKPVAAEAPGVLEWLQENLENIHQSLLEGDYAKVIEQLLGVQDSLANNAHFNALLYIAYMGNGEESKAAALLANVDPSEFADAFLESAEALKGNADIEAIKRKLMDSMMELSQTNPKGFEAVAKIGANIQNSNPDDPTIYAARYIAALAMGDQAAIDAILAEAKAHGVTAETLSTATVEYIETHNVTSITVQDAERGITTSTVYNAQGQATKSKVVITKEDGSQEIRIDNARGTLMAVIYVNPNGKIEKRVEYIHSDTPDENGNTLKGYNVYTYQDGVLTNQTLYTTDDVAVYDLVYDETGAVTDGYRVVRGQKKPLSEEERDALGCVKDDEGNVIQMSQPRYDKNGALIGKTVTDYDYTVNTRGLPRKQSVYDAENKLVSSQTREYNYDSNRDGVLVKIEYTYYDADENITGGGYVDYQNNKAAEYNNAKSKYIEKKLDEDGRVVTCDLYDLEKDAEGNPIKGSLISHTETTYYADGSYQEVSDLYVDGTLYWKDTKTYDDKGCVLTEVTTKADTGEKVQEISHEYYKNGNKAKKTTTSYDVNGKIQSEVELRYDVDGKTEKSKVTNEYVDGNLVKETKENYAAGWKQEIDHTYENGNHTQTVIKTFTNGTLTETQELNNVYKDGLLTYQILEVRDQNGNLKEKQTAEHVYNDEGIRTEQKVITYEADGETVKKEVYVEYDADGETVKYKEEAEYVDGKPVKITVEEATQRKEQTFEDGLDGDLYIYKKVDDQWILDTISTPVYDGEDIVGKVDKSVDKDGNISSEVEYVFDENGDDVPVRETKYTYEDGNVTQTVETNYSYNEDGTLEGTTENTYDADGNLVDTKYFDADGNEIEKPEDLELAAEGTGEDSLNPAPEEPEETEVPEETEEPAESEDGEDPTLPDISDIPGLPDISDIPGLPDISDIPGLPDISDIPGLPDISDIPGLPDISDIPGLPDISDIPGLPDISEIPGLPDISDIPGLPDISDIPGLPDISEVPGMSDFLENMDYGQIAEYVESLKDYAHPEDVEVPDFREYFENTEDPGFLKVAEAVDRIQHPEEPQEPETAQETEAADEETAEAPAEPEPAPVEAEKSETPELPKAPEEAKKPEEPEEPDTPEEPEVPAGE